MASHWYHARMANTPEQATQSVKFVTIDADHAGQRIDNFLITQLKGVPKSRIYRIVRKGEVRVNKGRIKQSYRLKDGDTVRIPPIRLSEKTQARPRQSAVDRIAKAIVFENDALMIINKPSGMAVHGGSGLSYGVIEAIRAARPDCRSLELVHRLDRETSGCLLVTKKRSALRDIHEQIRNNKIRKTYIALLKGQWRGKARDVDAPLLKNQVSSGERFVVVDPQGKKSLSRFTPLSVSPVASLLKVSLFTGRTHQIRVHSQFCEQPIAGDPKYGDREFNQTMKNMGLKRMFLHAARLGFYMPGSGEWFELDAPLDDNLLFILNKLGMEVPHEL